MPAQLVLASASPRRLELLEKVGFSVKTMPAIIDESVHLDELPDTFVKRVARSKVLSVVDRIQQTLYTDPEQARIQRSLRRDVPLRWVLGADTVVVLENDIICKPDDNAHAADILESLQGREHEVLTGFCLYDMQKSKEGLQAVQTSVRMKAMSAEEIERYLAVGESMDKAGAYAIQEVGSYLIDSIVGSYTNVVGLPICQIVEMMDEMSARDILPW